MIPPRPKPSPAPPPVNRRPGPSTPSPPTDLDAISTRIGRIERLLGLADEHPDAFELIRRDLRNVEDKAGANEAAIGDNVERIIGLEARIADL